MFLLLLLSLLMRLLLLSLLLVLLSLLMLLTEGTRVPVIQQLQSFRTMFSSDEDRVKLLGLYQPGALSMEAR